MKATTSRGVVTAIAVLAIAASTVALAGTGCEDGEKPSASATARAAASAIPKAASSSLGAPAQGSLARARSACSERAPESEPAQNTAVSVVASTRATRTARMRGQSTQRSRPLHLGTRGEAGLKHRRMQSFPAQRCLFLAHLGPRAWWIRSLEDSIC